MQYPGTIDKWYDLSNLPTVVADVAPRPVFLTAAAFDRGPEKITTVYGTDFYRLYGSSINFDKYGQAGIQAANIINNGGELLIKRVVADDATLANAVVVAKVSADKQQKVDSKGRPLYIDPITQKETTEEGDGNEKAMINVAVVKVEVATIPNKKTLAQVVDAAEQMLSEEDDNLVYPLFVITDNGRGKSTKRIAIDPQYTVSKNLNHMLYKCNYLGIEDFDSEYVYFTVPTDIMYLSKSTDIGMACAEMKQVNAASLSESVDKFYTKLADISGIAVDELYGTDVLFAKTKAGNSVQGLAVDSTSYDLSSSLGFTLESGTNGEFGDYPIKTDAYEHQLIKFYNGTFDEDIFNLDMYKPAVCVDANYPYSVKETIVKLAEFRKDFYFFADLGLDCSTYESAVSAYESVPKDKFTAWYGQSYKIMNPFNKKYIDVTITYGISKALIAQLNTRTNAPYCGILNNWILTDVIEGTVNFLPKITPTVNQKEQLGNMKLNYASILQGGLVMETEYTSQEYDSQLSFINNVIAIQYIIRDVREQCPAYRYSFISTNDLSVYKQNVSKIITKYTNWFESLEFVYAQDEVMAANKIFSASLKVKHKNFVQAEIMNIYVLGTENTSTETTAAGSVTAI